MLRQNLRVAASHGYKTGVASKFTASTDGCHHLNLVDAIAQLFNSIPKKSQGAVITLPVLPRVNSNEMFGLVSSEHTETFGGLLTIKDEETEDLFMSVLEAQVAEMGPDFEIEIAIGESSIVNPQQQTISIVHSKNAATLTLLCT